MAGQELAYLSSEQELIEEIKSIIGTKYIGDDCARLPGNLLMSSDSLVDGTHFLSKKTAIQDIGWKSMAVNLSDIAGMAGRPRYATVALIIPNDFRKQDFTNLYKGLAECAALYKTTIVGGDISVGTVLTIVITIIGEEHESGCLKRSGAMPGDAIVVTGHFGASCAGLNILLEGAAFSAPFLNQHLRPTPRLSESWQFVKRTGNRAALMDTSDGLADALAQIARSSQVGMVIDLKSVPSHAQTQQIAVQFKKDPFELALYGGEDYELVGCLPESVWQSWLLEEAVPFTKVGTVTKSGKIELHIGDQPGPKFDLSKCFQHIAKGK